LKGDIYLGIRSQPLFVELYTLIEAAKLTDVEPQAWLANAVARLQNHPAKYIDELLPWNWRTDHAGSIRRILNHTWSNLRLSRDTQYRIKVWILEDAQAEWGTSKFPWRSRVLSA
jgi:hypothetical protein